MDNTMVNAALVASGMYVPSHVLDNAFFIDSPNNPYKIFLKYDESGNPVYSDKVTQLTEEKIQKNTGGIRKRRRIAEGETLTDMLEMAFKDSGFPAEKLEGIIIGTISDSAQFPSEACKLQKRIGATNVTNAYDVKAACSGFTHALDDARLHVQESGGYWLVAGIETLTKITDYNDINCNLFGDGCGLAILGPTKENEGILATACMSDTSGLEYIYRGPDNKLRMPEGPKVLVKATKGMIELAHKLSEKVGIPEKEIKLYIPHQANGRIIDAIEERIDMEKQGRIFRNIGNYGNMSSATVPIALTEAIRQGRAKKGDLITLVDMGSGLAFGGALIRL